MNEKVKEESTEEVDVFEQVYNSLVSPESEKTEEVVVEKTEETEEKEVKPEPAQEPAPTKPESTPEQKPFSFEEDKLYPVPGKDGIEYVPFKKLKRWLEAGRGASQVMEKMKRREEELASPIAISEGVKDLPPELQETMYQEIKQVVDKYRAEAKLGKKFDKPSDPLPKEDRSFLQQLKTEREHWQQKQQEEIILTKAKENVTEVVKFAKEQFGVEIDEALGEKLRQAANKYSDETGTPLHQVDLIGVFTRLVPAHIRVNLKNQMELAGQVVKKAAPVVAPKGSPAPKSSSKKKKLSEMSGEEAAALDSAERDNLASEQLREWLGR